MAELIKVNLSDILPNPHRNLECYPYREPKIATLLKSINDIGFFEGVIGRRAGNQIEIAFGHHRIEAARRSGLKSANVIVRDLDDEQMFRFMAHENMEDYNADFLTMLETWEAAVNFVPTMVGNADKPIEIAEQLGWIVPRSKGAGIQMNRTAEACNAGHALISGGHLKRKDLHDIPIRDAREILTRANANMKRLDKMAAMQDTPESTTKKAKRQIAKSVALTVKQSRQGEVSKNDLRGRVDVNTYRFAREAKVQEPLFEAFGKQLAGRIEAMIGTDVNADKLAEIEKVLSEGIVDADEDHAAIELIKLRLRELSTRSAEWLARLSVDKMSDAKPTLKGIEYDK